MHSFGVFRLERLKHFYAKHRFLPSYSRMLRLFNVSSKNSVHKIINKFVTQGYFTKDGGRLVPTKSFFALPYSGVVKAGFPTGAENTTDFLSLDEYLIEKPTASFLLKVSGDSLSGIGIMPDDLVVVERTHEPKNGDIVLAHIDREWTLKILEKKDGTVLLISANPKYPPFQPQEELEIYGKVKAVIRKF